ncbi:hypothetical protein EXD82_02895 [Peptacetobacter hominis]|uniref:Uncharacterized protein n=1 Tax=Peptacetobacter hominis TaxID=2743610 RepID=A0A544QWI7_9FIRM|nr:hypothetical protein [Peptacetobacter hominis]TQQ85060.1 hypothetical protein EXD82_02895 [Peptacetobacter hominis]
MKFIYAKITNSRLMGSMGLIIKREDENGEFYQYFLLDSEGLGLCDYVSLRNPSDDEKRIEEERLMGGLGSDRIFIEEEEALFLIKHFGSRNIKYGKELSGNIDEYIDIINNFETEITIYDMFPKICKKIETEVEFVNYMVMRLIAWDREGLTYYSKSEEIGSMHITKINGALLKTDVHERGNGKYVVDVIYEDSDGYYSCKMAVNIAKDEELGFRLESVLIADIEPMYDFEVFDEISKEEYVTVYTINGDYKEFAEKFYVDNPYMLKSDMEDAVFFTRFNFNNDHVGKKSYVINNDIKAIYYCIDGMFFVGTYSERDRDYINGQLKAKYSEYIEFRDEMFFEQNALYDFVESGNEDFYDFLDE